MTDIVERLRGMIVTGDDMNEAADEIVRLRDDKAPIANDNAIKEVDYRSTALSTKATPRRMQGGFEKGGMGRTKDRRRRRAHVSFRVTNTTRQEIVAELQTYEQALTLADKLASDFDHREQFAVLEVECIIVYETEHRPAVPPGK